MVPHHTVNGIHQGRFQGLKHGGGLGVGEKRLSGGVVGGMFRSYGVEIFCD